MNVLKTQDSKCCLTWRGGKVTWRIQIQGYGTLRDGPFQPIAPIRGVYRSVREMQGLTNYT